MKKLPVIVILTVFMLVLAACGGAAAEPAVSNTAGLNTNSNDAAMMDETVAEEAPAVEEPAAVEPAVEEPAAAVPAGADESVMEEAPPVEVARPDWHFVPFTDVRTGQAMTFADLAGKTVYVEPMATWCGNCRRQLGNVAEAHAQLAGNEDVVFVALSVEPNMNDARLLEYADGQGFPFAFAKASPELLQGMVDAFGRTVTNPPSTPHFTIWPDGSMTGLSTGFESAADIVSSLQG